MKPQAISQNLRARNAEINWSQEEQGCGETRKLSFSLFQFPSSLWICESFLSPATKVHTSVHTWLPTEPEFTGTWRNTQSLSWFHSQSHKKQPLVGSPWTRCSLLAPIVQIWRPQLYLCGLGQGRHQRRENPCFRRQITGIGLDYFSGSKAHCNQCKQWSLNN